MVPSKSLTFVTAAAAATAYVGAVSYYQWTWYHGWPNWTFASKIIEHGWPCTYLTIGSNFDDPSIKTYHWVYWNLFLNSMLCVILTASVATFLASLARHLQETRGQLRFRLSSLIGVTTAVAMVYPLWKLIMVMPKIGENRWSFHMTERAIPAALTQLLVVGLFCAGWCVFVTFRLLFRNVNFKQPPPQPTVDAIHYKGVETP